MKMVSYLKICAVQMWSQLQIIFARSSPIIWPHICKEMNLNHFVLKNSWSLEVRRLFMYFVLKNVVYIYARKQVLETQLIGTTCIMELFCFPFLSCCFNLCC
jgi:hypothetical protein